MPIESRHDSTAVAIPDSVGRAFLHESIETLHTALAKIKHCLDQLDEQQIQWRPHESHNSIQNVILHLCGNVRQWVICGVSGAEDDRDRAFEFSDRRPVSKTILLERLAATVDHACSVLAAVDETQLLSSRRIQGFDTYLLAAIWDSVSHFVGHTHQIVYVTRQLIGDSYRFQFVPATVEQGAART